jgi:hypothetical protein
VARKAQGRIDHWNSHDLYLLGFIISFDNLRINIAGSLAPTIKTSVNSNSILARGSHFIFRTEAIGMNPDSGLRLFQNFEFVKEGRNGHDENDCNGTDDDAPNSAV